MCVYNYIYIIYILHYNYICIIISHYHITIYRCVCVCARAFFTSFLFWRRGSWPSWGAYGSPKQLWRASWTCPAPTCRAWSCIYLGKREGCTMRWVEPTCCNMLQHVATKRAKHARSSISTCIHSSVPEAGMPCPNLHPVDKNAMIAFLAMN